MYSVYRTYMYIYLNLSFDAGDFVEMVDIID